jgi:hypothetical protein
MHECAKPVASPEVRIVGEELREQSAQPKRGHPSQDCTVQRSVLEKRIGIEE